MAIRKLKLYSNIEKTNEDLDANMEIEQRLTISNNGKVIFSSSLYGDGYGHYHKGRKEEVTISQEAVEQIFHTVEEFFASQPKYNMLAGFGMFDLSILGEKNQNHEYFASTSGIHHKLTQYVQRRIPIDHLILFG